MDSFKCVFYLQNLLTMKKPYNKDKLYDKYEDSMKLLKFTHYLSKKEFMDLKQSQFSQLYTKENYKPLHKLYFELKQQNYNTKYIIKHLNKIIRIITKIIPKHTMNGGTLLLDTHVPECLGNQIDNHRIIDPISLEPIDDSDFVQTPDQGCYTKSKLCKYFHDYSPYLPLTNLPIQRSWIRTNCETPLTRDPEFVVYPRNRRNTGTVSMITQAQVFIASLQEGMNTYTLNDRLDILANLLKYLLMIIAGVFIMGIFINYPIQTLRFILCAFAFILQIFIIIIVIISLMGGEETNIDDNDINHMQYLMESLGCIPSNT